MSAPLASSNPRSGLATAALVVSLVFAPARDVLHFSPVAPLHALGAFAIGAVSVAWFQVWKRVRR